MGFRSLSEAIGHFERSIALDGRYALAYSALGTAYALSFLRSTNPDDLTRGAACLDKAIELDPELGDPYPWLCYLRMRKGDGEGALEAGRKAVELQPDLPEGHYFYGGALFMLAELMPIDFTMALHHLTEAIRIQPRFHPAYLVCGSSALMVGAHSAAVRLLTHAIAIEPAPDLVYRFVGARSLLAIAWFRQGAWERSSTISREAIDALKPSDHVYRDPFMTLSACALGDVALRTGDFEAALTHYRYAWRVVNESARMIARDRLIIRSMTGMAAAYAAVGDLARSGELADEAWRRLRATKGNVSSSLFELCYAHPGLAMAVAEIRRGQIDAGAQWVAEAVETGWRDRSWLLTDPELAAAREHRAFRAATDTLRDSPEITITLPPLHGIDTTALRHTAM